MDREVHTYNRLAGSIPIEQITATITRVEDYRTRVLDDFVRELTEGIMSPDRLSAHRDKILDAESQLRAYARILGNSLLDDELA